MMKKILVRVLVFALCLNLIACGAPVQEQQGSEAASDKTGAVATAVTGDVTVNVASLDELAAAIDPSGNTQVTILCDITYNKPIRLPYSCTIDFGGFTVATSPNDGNGIEIAAVGSDNAVTTIKNGTLTQYGVGVRVNAGGVVIEDMVIQSHGGTPLALMDTTETYKSVNCVKNSTLSSSTSSIVFYDDGASYFKTGITVENSTLISHDPEGSEVFSSLGTSTVPGVINLGENVQMYSYSKALAPKDGYVYSGKLAYRGADVDVSVGSDTHEGMHYWTTNEEKEVINVLMIGNSFCYYFVSELYGIADAADVTMNVTNLYKSGCSVEEHWSWLSDKDEGLGKYTYWVTNGMGRWNPSGITTSYDALEYQQWDVITLQQHFNPERAATYESAKASCDPYVKDYYDYLKKTYPDAKLYWQETWAYQAGHAEIQDKAAQTNQQNNIIQVSKEICQDNGVNMIPSGEAWVIARANELVGDTLCQTDLYHDGDVGGGQYLNACVWFEVLTGKSCIGNTWRPDYALSEELIAQLQLAAHQAVAEYYGEDYAK